MALVPSAGLPAPLRTLGALPGQQKFTFLFGFALIAAVLAAAWMWSQTPDYRVLYGQMPEQDGGPVMAALQQMNIPFKFADGSGVLMVPADRVHEARLKLAGQGLPKGGLVGFEVMENQKLGVSQFREQVNYQRALEGELARSIQAISAVQAARVHLAMPRPSVFLREQKKPSASVIVHLHPGRMLDASQVAAMVHLVSSSVADMPPKNVTVVDQHGSLLSSASESGNTPVLDPNQLKYRAELERMLTRRVEDILAPVVGSANVRAQVSADIDFSHNEQTAEVHKPNGGPESAVRSQQNLEAVSANPLEASGVPGALSNQPPAKPTAPVTGAAAPPAGVASATTTTPVNTRKETTVNYEVDRTIRYTRTAANVRRLSVAVVVNHRMAAGTGGKAEAKPLSAEEIAQLTNLVKEAVGYSAERGDTVNVVNAPFTVAEVAPVPEVPIWKRPENIELAKEVGKNLALGALALYLLFGVLRPMLMNLSKAAPAYPVVSADDLQQLPGGSGAENHVELARQIARQDPKVVANVVKGWVGRDGG